MTLPRVTTLGDSALLVRFEDRIDLAVNRRIAGIARALAAARIRGVRDIVPAFRSLAVYYDPAVTDSAALERSLGDMVAATIDEAIDDARPPIRIPVEYGGETGPDLESVAALAKMSADEVVTLHCAVTYRVFMLGFVPGFAYLAPVDGRIAMPRLDAPRTRVPAGSVGIAGAQTGIYPAATPGGWRLIGRTDVKPFDLAREKPFLFNAGDRVQFYRV